MFLIEDFAITRACCTAYRLMDMIRHVRPEKFFSHFCCICITFMDVQQLVHSDPHSDCALWATLHQLLYTAVNLRSPDYKSVVVSVELWSTEFDPRRVLGTILVFRLSHGKLFYGWYLTSCRLGCCPLYCANTWLFHFDEVFRMLNYNQLLIDIAFCAKRAYSI